MVCHNVLECIDIRCLQVCGSEIGAVHKDGVYHIPWIGGNIKLRGLRPRHRYAVRWCNVSTLTRYSHNDILSGGKSDLHQLITTNIGKSNCVGIIPQPFFIHSHKIDEVTFIGINTESHGCIPRNIKLMCSPAVRNDSPIFGNIQCDNISDLFETHSQFMGRDNSSERLGIA